MNLALFHGTNSRRAARIDVEGLRTRQKPRWPLNGNRRYVYLTTLPQLALRWGGLFRSDICPVVCWIDAGMLDPQRLEDDPACHDAGYFYRYRGAIPREALVWVRGIVERKKRYVIRVEPADVSRVGASTRNGFEDAVIDFDDDSPLLGKAP